MPTSRVWIHAYQIGVGIPKSPAGKALLVIAGVLCSAMALIERVPADVRPSFPPSGTKAERLLCTAPNFEPLGSGVGAPPDHRRRSRRSSSAVLQPDMRVLLSLVPRERMSTDADKDEAALARAFKAANRTRSLP